MMARAAIKIEIAGSNAMETQYFVAPNWTIVQKTGGEETRFYLYNNRDHYSGKSFSSNKINAAENVALMLEDEESPLFATSDFVVELKKKKNKDSATLTLFSAAE